MSESRVVIMVEGALCVAFSVVLSYLLLFRMPQGGSVTLELVPLIVFAWRRGARWGCAAGALAGVLHMMLGGYVVHPLQALLDYPLAYAAIGLAGMWKGHKIPGLILGGVGQFFCHLLAGVVFFASYAPAETTVWIYSGIYNVSFLAPKVAISALVAWFLWKQMERGAVRN